MFTTIPFFICFLLSLGSAQKATPSSTAASIPSATTAASTSFATATGVSSTGSGSASSSSTAPDVYLNVPQLHVGELTLDVDSLVANINLNANVASLVSINADIAVSVQKVNITIREVDAQLELVVRLGHLVDIVNRVFSSLDSNPSLLSSILGNVTSAVTSAVGAVNGLLGSVTQGGTNLSFIVDNLGNIVQQVAGSSGSPVSSIVGNYLTNMTYTGTEKTLSGGLVQKTYSYSPLNALVNIVTNAAGQVVTASVLSQGSGATSTSAVAASTARAKR